jgi:hypothetical protein
MGESHNKRGRRKDPKKVLNGEISQHMISRKTKKKMEGRCLEV